MYVHTCVIHVVLFVFQGYPAEGGNLKVVCDDDENEPPTKDNILKAIR